MLQRHNQSSPRQSAAFAGAHFVIVPFRTSPDVVVGLLRNDVQLAMDFYAALKPTLNGGKGCAIATCGPQRSPELPNVPTVQETGVAGFDVVAWNGLYAPADTPQDVINILNKALHEVLADPALKKRAGSSRLHPCGASANARRPQSVMMYSVFRSLCGCFATY
jgi:tripartite-type tricarboxylate transporter receptor subunit TctC